jgi:anaerobic nitric oxide reductase flavorubredoxin
MNAIKMSDGIYRIGANIENGDLFEGMWPIPDGVSLNSYVVKGEKIALVDLVRDWNNAPTVIQGQLSSIGLDFSDIDHLVLNHLEPDHTGWMLGFYGKDPGVQIITTEKGAEVLKGFFGIENNVRVIKSGDTLDLGAGMELLFEEAPNVHWPETMVTYEKSSGILFSCDAFGAYGSVGEAVFDDQISDEEHAFFDRESLRYYANIVSSYSAFVLRAIDKISDLKINMIAPSHGIIWREKPQTIIDKYRRFAEYYKGPAEPEITVVWGSMYGYTQSVLNSVVQGIRSENVPVHTHQVPNEDVSWALASAWKSAGLVFGMPTYEYKMFPPMSAVIDMFARKHVQNKKVFRFGSYGWSGGAQKEFKAMTEKLNWEFLDPVEWHGRADEETHRIAADRGRELAKQVKAMTA